MRNTQTWRSFCSGVALHGKEQTIRYIDLGTCCAMLADNPKHRSSMRLDSPRPSLHRARLACLSYRRDAGGILVSRILHQHFLPELQALDEGDARP